MDKTFERLLIEQCAPTLAGMKTGSLFTYQADGQEATQRNIEKWNRKLWPRGIHIVLLRRCEKRFLIYVYREKKMEACLGDSLSSAFLNTIGYDVSSLQKCIFFLKRRMKKTGGFPHEIGLFLGYPLEDVIGFIENKGKNFCCCGYWKVYADRCAAQKNFARFKKCKSVYMDLFRRGKSALQLTVPA